MNDRLMANGLGWFSIGLGVAQIAAPGGVARMIGLGDDQKSRQMMHAVGLREIASGIGILSQSRPAGWLWARAGGDVMDLALLGGAFASEETRKDRLAMAMAAVLGVAAMDVACARRLGGREQREHRYAGDRRRRGRLLEGRSHRGWSGTETRGVHIRKAVTLNRAPEEVYGFWRDLRNLPSVLHHLEEVTPMDGRRSHWRAKGPAGSSFEWDAEITEDRPNELLAWRSLPGAEVPNSGWIRFETARGGRGTRITVDLRYVPPGGMLGARIARLFGREPGQEVQEDLRAFKQVMETGEVTRSDASSGRVGHPARPASREERERAQGREVETPA
jgi:uncharacterized membrane protein